MSFTIAFVLLVFFAKLTTRINGDDSNDVGCMTATATFFPDNLPLSSKGLIEYLDKHDIANGILPPCPSDGPPNQSSCNVCSKKGDLKCCENQVCPCLEVKENGEKGTCPKPDQPLIFNLQLFTVNEFCQGVYTTWSIFNGTGEEEEFFVIPIVDKTTPLVPILDKYIYLTGFGAKNIDGYYVTYYAYLRICAGTLKRVLKLKSDVLLGELIGLDNCICELKEPFTSSTLYMAKSEEFNPPPDNTLFTFVSKSQSQYSFIPSSAENHEKKCESHLDCSSILCSDKALVKCCVSGICKCVANSGAEVCPPCSSSGVFVGEMLHCNNLGEEYLNYYSIYKKKDGCDDDRKDTSFLATTNPENTEDPLKRTTLLVGNVVHTTDLYQFTWYGTLTLSPTTVDKILEAIDEDESLLH